MKKKVLLFILVFISCIAFMFGVTACNKDGITDVPPPAQENPDDNKPHTHNFGEWVIIKNATCTMKGSQARYCDCGEVQTSSIGALGHDLQHHAAQEATCTEKGWGQYDTCSRCDYSTYKEVAPLNHKLIPTAAKAANCTNDGNIAYWYCSGCDKYFSDKAGKVEIQLKDTVVKATGHSMINYPAQPATCTKNGNSEYWRCKTCEKYFSDEKGNNQIHYIDTVLVHLEHNYLQGVCTLCEYTQVKLTLSSDETYYYVSGVNEMSLSELIIPESFKGLPVKSIGSLAFNNCKNLSSIAIPDSVTSIGVKAFYNCSSLTSITIPDSVTNIEPAVLGGCSSLESITVPFIGKSKTATVASESTLFGYFFGEMSFADSTLTEQRYGSKPNESITYWIPKKLKNIVIAGGNILYGAFQGCGNLTDIKLLDDVKIIGTYAFSGSSFTNIILPDSVTFIGSNAFRGCSLLSSIKISNSVTSIGEYTFAGCSMLTNITIPDKVTGIGSNAFQGCSLLTSISMPDTVTNIGKSAFDSCRSLKNINFPEKLKDISDYTFVGCTSLTGVTIPDSVMHIGRSAFYSCKSLEKIALGKNVKTIGKSAFALCESLSWIILPNSVASIDDEAFYHCNKVKICCESASAKAGWSEYWNIVSCDSVILGGGYNNPQFKSVYYNARYKDEMVYKKLTNNTFAIYGTTNNSEDITIPDTVEFNNITYKVVSICYGAFSGRSSLKSINIPDSVTSIDGNAFYNCISLTNVKIGRGVTTIKYSAFSGCSKLTSVYYKGTEEDWNNIQIGNGNKNLTSATRYYYSENNPYEINADDTNKYWRYDTDGVTPVVWEKDISALGV